jgi:hypothetical protein
VEGDREWEEDDGAQGRVVRCDGEVVAMMNVAAPLPRDPQGDVWVRAALDWKEAPAVEANHGAHVIVARHGGANDPLREARVITAAIGGLLDVVPECAGVVWSAPVARPVDVWKTASQAAFAPHPNYPVPLWIDVAAVRTGAELDVVTVGLRSFVDWEIEWEVGRLDPGEVPGNVIRLAAYLIEHGSIVKHGVTLSRTETERTIVTHATSRRDDQQPVLRVTHGGT